MGNSRRKIVFTLLFGLMLATLVVRFFYLQIYQWDRYRQKSDQNRVRANVLNPSRGLFFDRNGEILVENHPSFTLLVVPSEMPNQTEVLAALGTILGEDPKDIRKTILNNQISPFAPIRIKRDIEYKTLCYLQEYKLDLPGVVHQTEAKRYYPSGVKGAHVFGYCAEISQAELKHFRDSGYRQGDIIGKKGLESQYEHLLRGEPGVKYVEVDVLGREIRELTGQGEKEARPGKNIILTLDAELQRLAENLIQDLHAVIILIDTRSGGVLALASKPDFDLEIFSSVLNRESWLNLISDPAKPLYDRALQSVYPPGSTYKLIAAMAALEEKIIDVNYKNFCPGYITLGLRNFFCWNKGGHGDVNILSAIEQSCNVFFYKLNARVGIDLWAQYSRKFGFGKPTGIDLPAESSGLLPDRDYLDAHYGKKKWTRGMLFNLGVGQGDLLVTPLQLAQFAMMLANKGEYYRPHLLAAFVNPLTNDTTWVRNSPLRIEGISDYTFNVILEGMQRVVSQGTGRAAWLQNYNVAGKTGTAQNPHGKDHAWFIGFAPFSIPEVSICVFIENGGGGGANAAPIARKMLHRYFQLYSGSPGIRSRIAGLQYAQ